MSDPTYLAPKLAGLGTTVFSEINALAARHDAVNLGQGAPDIDGPDFIKEAAIRAIQDGPNQYSPAQGLPDLTRAICEHQERFRDLSYDPDREITVCAGATEAIFAALQGLTGPGDEVILFEPYYDSYLASLAMSGATPKAVTLHAPDFRYDPDALEEAIGPRTRVLLLNTPHNPSGRVFDRPTLEHLAELARRHDLLVISDEVYEHLVFDGEHVSIASLPGMRERTVVISSSAKTFSFTGWKVGWACAPPEVSAAIRTAHQFITFCTASPLQQAIAVALRADDGYFDDFRREYRLRRDLLHRGLVDAGFRLDPPQGTYFMMADIRPLGFEDDREFCDFLPREVGVAAIPPTAFYVNKENGRHLARFSFCKSPETIARGVDRLREGLRSCRSR